MDTRYRLDSLITVPELAGLLKIKEKTVRDWVYRRVVPFTKLRGRVYFDSVLVQAVLARNAREPLASRRPVCSPEAGKPERGGASQARGVGDGS